MVFHKLNTKRTICPKRTPSFWEDFQMTIILERRPLACVHGPLVKTSQKDGVLLVPTVLFVQNKASNGPFREGVRLQSKGLLSRIKFLLEYSQQSGILLG